MLASVVIGHRTVELNALYETANTVAHDVAVDMDRNANPTTRINAIETIPQASVAVFDSEGELIARAGRFDLDPIVGRALVEREGYSVAQVGIQDQKYLVVGGMDWGVQEYGTRHLAMILFGLWAFLVAAAALVTWLAAGAALQPLMALTKQAEALSHGKFGGRLSHSGGDEYAEFAGRLNKLLDEVEASAELQERFVADAAHELRTPITVFRGHIESTLLKGRTTEEYRQTLSVLLVEAERFSILVESLLQSALPVSQDVEPLNLESACEIAHARWVDRYEAADVELQLDLMPCSTQITEGELGVVLDNLLSNALRVSNPDSQCILNLRLEGEEVVIGVDDEGGGITEGDLERIFDRFARLDTSRSRSFGGFGIGLAVCRRIVEGRAGTIRALNLGRGTRIEVRFRGGMPGKTTPAPRQTTNV